jgi:hypothetical protein
VHREACSCGLCREVTITVIGTKVHRDIRVIPPRDIDYSQEDVDFATHHGEDHE